ncbi:cytochrome C oxidase subunit IV family protein [Mycolicibacterium sp. A43C]
MTDTKRLTYVWIVLSVVTVVTWLLGHEPKFGRHATIAIALAILGIAFVKVYLIIRHFMEVRMAPLWLRIVSGGWLVMLAGSIVALYLW